METSTLLPVIGIGVIVLSAGFGTIWSIVALRRRRDWTPTTGEIVGSAVQVSTSSNGVSGSSKALIIQWRGADGLVRRYTENFSRTRFRVPIGRQVRLFLHPRDLHRATRALIAPGVIVGVAGIVVGNLFTAISILASQ